MPNSKTAPLRERLSKLLLDSALNLFLPIVLPLALVSSVFMLIVWSSGHQPFVALGAVSTGAFGNSFALRETLSNAIPILLCALAVAVPARVGLINLGAEGQLHMGAIAASAVALHATHLPSTVTLFAMALAACLSGAIWAGIVGLLRSVWGVNEILVGLMLNYIAILTVEHLVHGPWKDPDALGWPYTASFSANAVLPSWGNTNIHLGLPVGIGLAIAFALVCRLTIFGLSMRVIDTSVKTARYAGIHVGTYFVIVIAVGGAVAALAGMGEVSVVQGRLRPGISPGFGYVGFLVSWLVGHRFIAIIPAAIFVGGIYSGADELQLTVGLPSASADILVGFLFVAALIGMHMRKAALASVTQHAFAEESK